MSDQPPVNVNVNPSEPSFPVTLSAVYYELRGLSSKFDALAGIPARQDDHEARIREVEKAQAYFVKKSTAAWAFTASLALVMAGVGVLGLIIK